jgi:glutamate carboxypeptidase
VAIGFEDGDGDPSTAVIARRGSSSWTLEVSGQAAHSSQIFQPDVGAGAIHEAARILHGFYVALAGEELLTFNPGLVLGGTAVEFDPGKQNIVARAVVVSGDLRTISAEQLVRSREQMRQIVAEHLPGTDARIVFSDGYPPMAPTSGNLRLLALLDAVSRSLGQGPVRAVDPRNAGAADVSFVAQDVAMIIDGVGLMGKGGHTTAETADLRTLITQSQRVALLLYRMAAAGVPSAD